MSTRSALLLCVLLLPVTSAAQTRGSQLVARGPLSFEENRGQTDARVRFLARGKGYTLFLTRDEAVFRLGGTERDRAVMQMRLMGARTPSGIAGVEPLDAKSHYYPCQKYSHNPC